MENIDFVERINNFCQKNHITADNVYQRTGITKAHFYNVRNKKGPKMMMPFLVRFCRGFSDIYAEEQILGDIPIYLQPKDSNGRSTGSVYDFDLAAYSFLYYDSEIFHQDNRELYLTSYLSFLSSLNSFSMRHTYKDHVPYPLGFNDFIESALPLANSECSEKTALLMPTYDAILTSLHGVDYEPRFMTPHAYIFREFSKFSSYHFIKTGVVTWTDIAELISAYRDINHISNIQLDKEIGATQGLSGRFEYQQSKIYSCDDVLIMDTIFGSNYKFFALCYRATLTNLLLESMFETNRYVNKTYNINHISYFINFIRSMQDYQLYIIEYAMDELRNFFKKNEFYGYRLLSLLEKNKQFLFVDDPNPVDLYKSINQSDSLVE